ncbi:shikimate kinase [Desulfogranum marinum]|uniref:shikimate kinase n=1 Tax=Desulfogranum marinum TaxID=453220 RepID=UPI0019633D1A|nr:shikimate kinase [Desulfogranum marinum]MBM9511765.1 shikimate kinase [Desulfogranum marinum]
MQSILLTGFRATGKSLIGRLLAERLGYRFVDTDHELCRRTKQSVEEIVAERGWQGFRMLERALLQEMAGQQKIVLAVGGGAIEHEDIWQLLRAHYFIIWLQADKKTILSRMAADDKTSTQRPALTSQNLEDEIEEILARRSPLYASGSDMAVDTATGTPKQLVEQILSTLVKVSA